MGLLSLVLCFIALMLLPCHKHSEDELVMYLKPLSLFLNCSPLRVPDTESLFVSTQFCKIVTHSFHSLVKKTNNDMKGPVGSPAKPQHFFLETDGNALGQ